MNTFFYVAIYVVLGLPVLTFVWAATTISSRISRAEEAAAWATQEETSC